MFPCISTSISDVCSSVWISVDDGGGAAEQGDIQQMFCGIVLKSGVKNPHHCVSKCTFVPQLIERGRRHVADMSYGVFHSRQLPGARELTSEFQLDTDVGSSEFPTGLALKSEFQLENLGKLQKPRVCDPMRLPRLSSLLKSYHLLTTFALYSVYQYTFSFFAFVPKLLCTAVCR